MSNKYVSLAQLAFKAGKVSRGDQLIPSIQKAEAKLVCISELCGQNRKKKLQDKCAYYHIPWIEIPVDLFNQITSRSINSFGVLSRDFADTILNEYRKGQVTSNGK